MPYTKKSHLPDRVRDSLPAHGEEIYKEAFNSAWKQYQDKKDRQSGRSQEETAHAVAWSAVKNKYQKKQRNRQMGKEVKLIILNNLSMHGVLLGGVIFLGLLLRSV